MYSFTLNMPSIWRFSKRTTQDEVPSGDKFVSHNINSNSGQSVIRTGSHPHISHMKPDFACKSPLEIYFHCLRSVKLRINLKHEGLSMIYVRDEHCPPVAQGHLKIRFTGLRGDCPSLVFDHRPF